MKTIPLFKLLPNHKTLTPGTCKSSSGQEKKSGIAINSVESRISCKMQRGRIARPAMRR
jgi:hypothetical protein